MDTIRKINYHFCELGWISNRRVFFSLLKNMSVSVDEISSININKRTAVTRMNLPILSFGILSWAFLPIIIAFLIGFLYALAYFHRIYYPFTFGIVLTDGTRLHFNVRKSKLRKAMLFKRKINTYSKKFGFSK